MILNSATTNINNNPLIDTHQRNVSNQDYLITRIAKKVFSSISSVFCFTLAVGLFPIRLIAPHLYFNVTGYGNPEKTTPKPPKHVPLTNDPIIQASSQQPPIVNLAFDTGNKPKSTTTKKTVVIEPSNPKTIIAKVAATSLIPLTVAYFAKDWLLSCFTSQEPTQTTLIFEEPESTPVVIPEVNNVDENTAESVEENSRINPLEVVHWLTDTPEKSSTEQIAAELDTQEPSTFSDFTGWLTDNTETSPVTTETYLPPADSWTTSVFGSDIIPVQEHTTPTLALPTTLDTSLPQSVTAENVAYGAACVLGLAAGAWAIRKVWNWFSPETETWVSGEDKPRSYFLSRNPKDKINSKEVLKERVNSALTKQGEFDCARIVEFFLQFLDNTHRTFTGNLEKPFAEVKSDIVERIKTLLTQQSEKNNEEKSSAITNMLYDLTQPGLLPAESFIGYTGGSTDSASLNFLTVNIPFQFFYQKNPTEDQKEKINFGSWMIAYQLLDTLQKNQLVYTTRKGVKDPSSVELSEDIRRLFPHFYTPLDIDPDSLTAFQQILHTSFHLFQLLSQRTQKQSSYKPLAPVKDSIEKRIKEIRTDITNLEELPEFKAEKLEKEVIQNILYEKVDPIRKRIEELGTDISDELKILNPHIDSGESKVERLEEEVLDDTIYKFEDILYGQIELLTAKEGNINDLPGKLAEILKNFIDNNDVKYIAFDHTFRNAEVEKEIKDFLQKPENASPTKDTIYKFLTRFFRRILRFDDSNDEMRTKASFYKLITTFHAPQIKKEILKDSFDEFAEECDRLLTNNKSTFTTETHLKVGAHTYDTFELDQKEIIALKAHQILLNTNPDTTDVFEYLTNAFDECIQPDETIEWID